MTRALAYMLVSVTALACLPAAGSAQDNAAPSSAQGEIASATEHPPDAGAEPDPGTPPGKRPVPDYDSRPDQTTAGEVLLWIPRVLLSPLYVVSEYGVRRPLGLLVSEAERANLPHVLYNFFTFGPDQSMGIIPIALVDFGFDPSVGLYFFWDDALVRGHDLRVRVSTWGEDWLAARITDRIALPSVGARSQLVHESSALRRPDYVFYGLGPETNERDRSRYGSDRLESELRLEHGFLRLSRFTASVGVRSVHFRGSDYDDDEPSLEESVAAGVFAEPEGFARGYTLVRSRVELALDSRRSRPAPGTGVRVQVRGEHAAELRDPSASGFVRYGASVGGFYDLNDRGRVVSLSTTTDFVDPLGDSRVPFTELASVGGEHSMRGFFPGRLYDRSAAFATLRYRWPIWILLDGSIQLAIGNVFGEHLRDLRPGLLRFSGAIGIESVGSPDSSFELLVGMGTETFESGAEVTSARVIVGTNHGF